MSDSVKVSVIVPVYNSEKHLEQCLDSICGQSLKEIEILCIDDGSTDSSPQILETYRKQDLRIRIMHQKNQYAGVARNTGMSHAVGEYLVFWDSDDYFYETALEKMYTKITGDQADVCVCSGNQYYESRQAEYPTNAYLHLKQIPDEIPFNRHTNPKYILNFTNAAPWNKMYRRAYIQEKRLEFQPLRNGNDVYFVVNAICLADRITIIEEPLICYRVNESSGLVRSLSEAPLSPIQAWISIHDNLIRENAFPKQSFVNKALNSLIYVLRNVSYSWPSFKEAFLFLQKEGLQKLSIEEEPEEFYYTKWYGECVSHLKRDTPEEFLSYFMFTTYRFLTEANGKKLQVEHKKKQLSADKKKLKNRNKDLKEKNRTLTEKIQCIDEKNEKLKSKLGKQKKKNESLQEELVKIRESYSYRIGKGLLFLPRKLRNAGKKE